MQLVNNALVLNTLKYGENSLISTLLAEEIGVVACITKGATSSKSNKTSILQIGNIIEFSLNYNPQKSLQNLQDVRLVFNVTHGSIQPLLQFNTLFICELIYKIIKTHEPHDDLFQFTHWLITELPKLKKDELIWIPFYFTFVLINYLGFDTENWLLSIQFEYGTRHKDIINSIAPLKNQTQYKNHQLLTSLSDYITAHFFQFPRLNSLETFRHILK